MVNSPDLDTHYAYYEWQSINHKTLRWMLIYYTVATTFLSTRRPSYRPDLDRDVQLGILIKLLAAFCAQII